MLLEYKDMRLPKRFQNEPTCVKVKLLEEQNKAYRNFIELIVDDIHTEGHYHNDPVLKRLVEDARYLLEMTEEK